MSQPWESGIEDLMLDDDDTDDDDTVIPQLDGKSDDVIGISIYRKHFFETYTDVHNF